VIGNLDQKAIGYPRVPQIEFGAQMGFRYKGFDISLNWQGAAQVSRALVGDFRAPFLSHGEGVFQWYLDRTWTPERAKKGVKGLLPRLSVAGSGGAGHNYQSSTMWVVNASYLRLKNAEIGYTFSTKVLKKIGVRSIRMYVNGYNLYTFKSPALRGVDVERTHAVNSNHYPIMRIYNFGFNIKF
jgi:hypothetical protein